RCRGPVVARRDRPRARAQLARQRGPDQHPVEVALVVGEVDALLGLRRAALPMALRAGDQAGNEREHVSERIGARHLNTCVLRAAVFTFGAARRLMAPDCHRPAAGDTARRTRDQCRKCRTPVNTIATPRSSAAAITSESRIEPPGWITQLAP